MNNNERVQCQCGNLFTTIELNMFDKDFYNNIFKPKFKQFIFESTLVQVADYSLEHEKEQLEKK